MLRLHWNHRIDPFDQATTLVANASRMGFLAVEFEGGGDGSGIEWRIIEQWTRSRAVTCAVLGGEVASPALDIALCSDLVYLLPSTRLRLAEGSRAPTPGVLWALGRAGRRALARGLLSTADLEADEAKEIGVAQSVVRDGAEPPIPEGASLAAVTTARDLMRAARPGGAGLALELASFRLLFAAGDPEEGAGAFLEKREPSF